MVIAEAPSEIGLELTWPWTEEEKREASVRYLLAHGVRPESITRLLEGSY